MSLNKPNIDLFDYDPNEDPDGVTYIEFLKKKFGVSDTPPEPIEPYPIVSRAEWGALPPKDPEMKAMRKPIQIAMFLQTETEECHSREDCIKFLQERQKLDMEEKEFDDIQFNFYISSDGTVYEGRGWHIEPDKNEEDYETANRSVDIAYIGNFEDKDLDPELIKKGADLIKWAKKVDGLMHDHINITTFWEDHVFLLKDYPNNYNPLDDPATREEEYKQEFAKPNW